MQQPEDVRKLVGDLGNSAWALATLSAAVETGLLGQLSTPKTVRELQTAVALPAELIPAVLDVLAALGLVRREGEAFVGATGLLPMLSPDSLPLLIADLRSAHFQSADFAESARRRAVALGWRYTDPDVLQAQGTASARGAETIARVLVPSLAGLAERFASPTAAFLDVGAGVGAIAIGICRFFPSLRVVGVEPGEAPHTLARRNVADAGLQDRVEIRRQGVEDIADEAAFDLAYLAQTFFPEDAFRRGLLAVYRALRPGGWLVTVAISQPGADLASALARLRNTLWGGGTRTPEEVAEALGSSGYGEVSIRPGAPASNLFLILGRRPPSG